jgi:hypothetical protein
MKRSYRLLLALLCLMILAMGSSFADESVLRYESVIIDTFDAEGSATYADNDQPVVWKVFGSKFSTRPNPEDIEDPANWPKQTYAMDTWPTDLFGAYPENREELGVLGIWSRYDRMGYNQFEIAAGQDNGGTWEQKPLSLEGRVKTIDFWVWGSNFNYYIELYVMDHRGFEYKLLPVRIDKLTGKKIESNLNFSGWTNFYIDIPSYIDQDVVYQPRNANMSITKFVVYTDPNEKVTDSYIYIDHLKMLTDTHEGTFDGYGLKEPAYIEKVWGSQSEE